MSPTEHALVDEYQHKALRERVHAIVSPKHEREYMELWRRLHEVHMAVMEKR